MEVEYQKRNDQTTVIYGETLSAMLRKEEFAEKQLVFCGNQRYYDWYIDKFTSALETSYSQDWFITTNDRYCNTMKNFEEALRFFTRFSNQRETIFIGIGNEGVMELLSFLKHVTYLEGELWLLPVSIRSFAQSLSFQHQIVWSGTIQELMEVTEAPNRILFDHRLADKQIDGRRVDLLTFICCGLVSDRQFLKTLYTSFSTEEKLMHRSFSAFIEPLLMYYQKSDRIRLFGKTFEQAFFKIESGQLLSNSMKAMFGLLFELAWNCVVNALDFNFKNFMRWFVRLGYPMLLPESFSFAEYGEHVLQVAKEKPLLQLNALGESGGSRRPTEKELLETFDYFQKIMKEIRGN